MVLRRLRASYARWRQHTPTRFDRPLAAWPSNPESLHLELHWIEVAPTGWSVLVTDAAKARLAACFGITPTSVQN
jgi:hypothetical protein